MKYENVFMQSNNITFKFFCSLSYLGPCVFLETFFNDYQYFVNFVSFYYTERFSKKLQMVVDFFFLI